VPFVLAVGVTGHRKEALPPDALLTLHDRLMTVLQALKDQAASVYSANRQFFSGDDPKLIFVSPLADGADQIAAEIALRLGYELHAMLPFDRDRYRTDMSNEDGRLRFDALLSRATSILELPGESSQHLESYVMAGRGTVAHCDLLIAVWDGLPPRGRGGTGEVVRLAHDRATPTIHVPVDPSQEVKLRWSAFDPSVVTPFDDSIAERSLDVPGIDALLNGLLRPPPDEQEQAFLKQFTRERPRNIRTRIEYPLLLAAAGVGRFGRKDFAEKHCEEQIRDEWRRYREGCLEPNSVSAPLNLLEEAYSWADRLATHFAQTYRSGHIFNFVLGSFAVCLGLSAFMAPHFKFEFAAAELVITIGIIFNAHVGTRNEWHRRWLDYRQLAERLRPMRSLKLLGIAAPDPPGTETNPVPVRWIDWYASAVWRAIGTPCGRIDRQRAADIASAVAEHEVAPQVGYHKRHAKQIKKLDHRLGRVGLILFLATLIVSVATLIGLAVGAEFVNRFGNWFTLVSAGFPALGTAVFGIRFQADFGGDAVRSLTTAGTLEKIEEELRSSAPLSRAADLTEQAARIMLSDLDEWRLVNEQRDLSVG
jgi:hypothetical protein